MPLRRFSPWRAVLWVLLLGGLGGLALAARCHNTWETCIGGQFYFVDGDCYSRMTRARMVMEHPGMIIHHHDFENFPDGVQSHTTAPFDYAIVLLKWVLDVGIRLTGALGHPLVWGDDSLDLAGVLIGPLLGAVACVYLTWWARWGLAFSGETRRRGWLAVPLFFALSPILVHGTLLGRPDHQAPMILLVVVALTAELSLLTRGPGWLGRGGVAEEQETAGLSRRHWCLLAGVAWGFALWISLFEPPLLCAGMALVLAVGDRRSLLRRERVWEVVPLVAIVLLMLLVEGSPIPHLAPEVKEYFERWSHTVGELRHLDPRGPLLYRWLGWGCLAAPFLLIWKARTDRRAWVVLVLFLAMLGVTCEYLRWGYFVGMAYALTLPWLFAIWRRSWIVWVVFVLALYPVAQEWDELLFPDDAAAEQRVERQRERVLLRDVAIQMRVEDGIAPFLAPWWLSPALAYWSGQPGVAGSSHEGLPGIVDSARFFLADDPAKAMAILERRRIAFVVVDEPSRTIDTSVPLLGVPASPNALGRKIYEVPHRAPRFLSLRYPNAYYKLFSVDTTRAQP